MGKLFSILKAALSLAGIKSTLWTIAGLAVTALVVAARIYSAIDRRARDDERAKFQRRQLEYANERIAIKDRQLEAAANRPSDDELDGLLSRGKFGR